MKFLVILCEILILGIAHLAKAKFSDKFHIRHLEPPEGPGYDLFYYDGVSLRDEKWRFDHANHDTAVNRRFGLRNGQSSQFHVVDTLSDSNGFRQKTRILTDPASIESLLAMGIEAPKTLNTFQKFKITPRIQSRDNSQHEGQPQDSSRGFLDGVTLGVTLNRPITPGDSFVQGYVQAGLGAQNNQPGLQFGVPNLGFFDTSRPSNEVPMPNRPLFGLPFFGNNRTPPPPQSPPPPQQQPGIFGLSFGNRNPTLPPALPVQPSSPVQSNFFSGLQNLNLPFIGQPQITTTTEIPATNPSLFGNFPSFGFQNNNNPPTTTIITTTPTSQGLFENLQFTFPNFGQTTTTTTAIPETTTVAKGLFGFNLPSISDIFQNNNGKDANKKINNRLGPPGHAHGHRHPSNHPPNRPPNHPNRPPQPPHQNEGGEILSKPVMTEPPATAIENLESSTFDFSEFFPASEKVTEKLSEELSPTPITTSIEKLVTEVPKEKGLLQSNAVEPSTDPDIPPPIQNPYVESLVAVVDKNSYALGVQETIANSFSSIEPALSSSTKPTDSLRSDDSEPTLTANIPTYPLPNVSQILSEFDVIKTENQIISDINSLSDNPPFPTMPNTMAEPPSVMLPYPLLELAPPFETEPGILGIHEDFVFNPLNTPESRDTVIPTVPGIIELIQKSQEKLSNEKLLPTEAPKTIESKFLHQDISQLSQKDVKSAEIIIKSMEPDLKSFSGNPPFPTMSNAVVEPPSKIRPYPLLELAPPFETESGVLGIHEDFVVDTAIPTVPGIMDINVELLPTETPKNMESNFLHKDMSQTSQKDVKSAEIIINSLGPDINSLSDNPPYPTKPNAVVEPSSVILPYPLLELAPPFETEPGIHENFVFNPINAPEPRDTVIPTVPGIIELIRKSQEKLSNEKLLPTEAPKNIESTFLHQGVSQPSQKDVKSAEIIIKSLVPDHKAQLPETEILPPFVGENVKAIEKNVTNIELNYVVPLETELLPPFESIPISDEIHSTPTDITTTTNSPKLIISIPITFTTPTTTTLQTLTLNNVESPEIDLLPPFERHLLPDETETPRTTTISTLVDLSVKNFTVPEIDLLPPFEFSQISDEVQNTTTDRTTSKLSPMIITMTPITSITPKTTAFVPSIMNNVGHPKKDLLPRTEGASPTKKPQVITSTATLPIILDEINNLIPPEIDLVPPFERDIAVDVESTRTHNIPKNITTIIRTTNISTLMVDLPVTNFTVPEISLLPPFEVLPVSNVVVKTASSTMKNQPKTIKSMITSQTTTPSRVESAPTTSPPITSTKTTATLLTTRTTNVIRLPESDLLPPYEADISAEMIVNSSALTTTDTPKTTTVSTTTRRTITSLTWTSEIPHSDADVTTTTSTTTKEPNTKPFIIIHLPESALLPPFEGDLVPDFINNSLSENSTSTPKTTITTTITPRRTTSSQRSTTKIPPKESILAVPDIDLLPPFEGEPLSSIPINTRASTTTIKPKNTARIPNRVEIVPEIHLLPPFEATINKITTALPRAMTSTTPVVTTTTTVTPNMIRVSESDLFTPLKSNTTVERPISFKAITTMPTIITTTSPTTTTRKIQNTQVTTTPQLVTIENVKPIYQRTTLTPPIKYPEVDLLPPYHSENNILPTKQTLSIAATPNIIMEVESRFTGNQLSDNPVLPHLPPPFNILTPKVKTTAMILSNTKSPTTINTKSLTTTSHITSTTISPTAKPAAHIPPPSKFFLPPFKTPSYSLELNTSSTRLTEAFDDSTAVGTTKHLDQSTIRIETDKIVNSVREIIENTTQTVLPTAVITPIQRTTRFDHSPLNKHHKFAELRSPPKHEARRHHQHRHKFHSHIRVPESELIAPPKLKPGQLDVFNLETFITQGGHNLNGPVFFGPNIDAMRVSPEVIPLTENPSEFDFVDKIQTTTKGLQMVMVADDELTTKAAVVVKRPIFVNVDDEDNTETTTSLLDVKLSPNAIKSLIG